VDRKLGRHTDSGAQACCAGAAVAHDQQVVWLGTALEELAGAIKRCAGSREEDIAPVGREDIGLAVTATGAMTISNSVMSAIFRRNDGQDTPRTSGREIVLKLQREIRECGLELV
jgi:hypothetical protein